jgi:hypothetical protein
VFEVPTGDEHDLDRREVHSRRSALLSNRSPSGPTSNSAVRVSAPPKAATRTDSR